AAARAIGILAGAAADVVDRELRGALVHVPEELEHGGVGVTAEDAARLPYARDGAGLERLDEEVPVVDREDAVENDLVLAWLVEVEVEPSLAVNVLRRVERVREMRVDDEDGVLGEDWDADALRIGDLVTRAGDLRA